VINFRYHVVSLTAVFLALAIGLVVGTAALNGPLSDNLHADVNALRKQNQQYRDQVNHLNEETNRQEQFATETAPYVLAGKLTGRRVLVLSMQSGTKYVDDVVKDLQVAGAKITGRVEVEDRFFDPASTDELLDIPNLSRPPSVAHLPTNSNGVETSTALLAAVLLDNSPSVPDDPRRTVVTAYTSGHQYLIVTGQVTGPAEAVVFVSGSPYVDRDAAKKNAAVVTMIAGLDQAGPIVVAGAGAGGDGNALAQVRGDPALTKTVSTVDNVSTSQGQVTTALALAEQIGTHAGHYGVDAGANALVPKASGEGSHSGP
jgi:hypothetical protein